jgi:hypothetical protein
MILYMSHRKLQLGYGLRINSVLADARGDSHPPALAKPRRISAEPSDAASFPLPGNETIIRD